MRNLVIVAVVMLVASMIVSSLATAADSPPFEEYRCSVTRWADTCQEALALVDAELLRIDGSSENLMGSFPCFCDRNCLGEVLCMDFSPVHRASPP